MEKRIEMEQTETQETYSMVPQEISDLLEDRSLVQVRSIEDIAFTPDRDAAITQEIADIAAMKIRHLGSIDVMALLTEESSQKVLLDTEDESDSERIVTLQSSLPKLEDVIRVEGMISKAISNYSKVVQTSLKERRMLSGHLYGSLLLQTNQMSRITKTSRVSASQLLQNIGQRSSALSPMQDMLPIEDATYESLPEPSKTARESKGSVSAELEEDLYSADYE